ncbi:hypothetical protein PGB28_16080 [Primorskyibacter aestuariivivens]|uniref:hypothetical protein n=1 Tax=Primorskyibacter aestuariivivens TaxID=1888912 RepID=UPI002300DADD|nr:hypothetical protein [Primorskyibacter aestuariivivens]MDA7429984.1 hypothetical protein [Primorskyibacter aestuariivivens]
MKKFCATVALVLVGTVTQASPDPNGPAGFTTVWHGHGANHQGNNTPGDTAADRHNFGGATAGNSGTNPAAATQAGQ